MTKKLKLRLNQNDIQIVLLFLSMLFLTRQFPFAKLGRLSSYILVISFTVSIRLMFNNFSKLEKKYKSLTIFYVLLITGLLIKSLLNTNISLGYSIHTYITCLLLIISFFYPKDKRIFKMFVFVMLLHALFMIGLELFLIVKNSPEFDSIFRNYILINGFGDIYTRNGIYYRIIIKGNELLPVAYLVMYKYKSKKANIIKGIFILSILISGNLAYFIAIGLFLILNDLFIDKKYSSKIIKFFNIKNQKKIIAIGTVLLVLGFIGYKPVKFKVENIIELKSQYSIPARFDQIGVLIDDMNSGKDYILGKGLGSTVTAVTRYRDYTGNRYFEMQWMYFFYQMGAIAFGILIILSIILSIKYMRNKLTILIYLTYIIYGITNPYTFNLTHIIVIILLTTYDLQLKEENNNEVNYIYK